MAGHSKNPVITAFALYLLLFSSSFSLIAEIVYHIVIGNRKYGAICETIKNTALSI